MSNKQAKVVVSMSLSGGQGKTLTAYMLGIKASKMGLETLLIDADPQRNLTDLLRLEVESNEPTLLEVIQGDISAEQSFYPVPDRKGLYIIPADRALNKAQHYLSQVGNSAAVLKLRLKPLFSVFDLIIIDTPPQKGHLGMTSLGASDFAVIPAEVAAKGVNSLSETWALIEESKDLEAFKGNLIGVLPFRARWVGNMPTTETRSNMALMKDMIGDLLLPPLLESEVYKKAINYASLPSEVAEGKEDLEYPFEVLLQKIFPAFPQKSFRTNKVVMT
jgi:chromosome partitioning protein